MSASQNSVYSKLDNYLNKTLPGIIKGLKEKLIGIYNYNTDPVNQQKWNELRMPQDWKKTTPTPAPTSPINNYLSPSPTPTQGRQVPGGRIISSEIIPTQPSAINNYINPTPTPTTTPKTTPTPTPTTTPIPTPSIVNDYVNPKPTVTPAPTPTPMISPNLTEVENNQMNGVVDYYRKRRPDVKAEEWYPMWNDIPYMYQKEQELKRPGLGTLLALIPIWESNGGRNPKTGEIDTRVDNGKPNRNVYRALIGGEKKKIQPEFNTYREAIDYVLSENMFGGGANENMNILKNKGPITTDEIKKLYKSYNPTGDYVRPLLDEYSKITGIY